MNDRSTPWPRRPRRLLPIKAPLAVVLPVLLLAAGLVFALPDNTPTASAHEPEAGKRCPAGYVLDNSKSSCTKTTTTKTPATATCATGNLAGGKCVTTATSKTVASYRCTSGTLASGAFGVPVCKHTASKRCPAGYRPLWGGCYHPVTYKTTLPSCPSGYAASGGSCVKYTLVSWFCAAGRGVLQGTFCALTTITKANPTYKCSQGGTKVGSQCHTTTIQTRPFQPTCSDTNHVLNSGRNKCVHWSPPPTPTPAPTATPAPTVAPTPKTTNNNNGGGGGKDDSCATGTYAPPLPDAVVLDMFTGEYIPESTSQYGREITNRGIAGEWQRVSSNPDCYKAVRLEGENIGWNDFGSGLRNTIETVLRVWGEGELRRAETYALMGKGIWVLLCGRHGSTGGGFAGGAIAGSIRQALIRRLASLGIVGAGVSVGITETCERTSIGNLEDSDSDDSDSDTTPTATPTPTPTPKPKKMVYKKVAEPISGAQCVGPSRNGNRVWYTCRVWE